MAPGLPDLVDCASLADAAVVLERDYPLGDMPRLRDLLADARGSVHAQFAFARVAGDRAGARVAIEATPRLICQRCLEGFDFAAAGSSEIEFSSTDGWGTAESPREIYAMEDGLVSLRGLAEEELLLALPIVAVCGAGQKCEHAPVYDAGADVDAAPAAAAADRSRPFAHLQELLKKT